MSRNIVNGIPRHNASPLKEHKASPLKARNSLSHTIYSRNNHTHSSNISAAILYLCECETAGGSARDSNTDERRQKDVLGSVRRDRCGTYAEPDKRPTVLTPGDVIVKLSWWEEESRYGGALAFIQTFRLL